VECAKTSWTNADDDPAMVAVNLGVHGVHGLRAVLSTKQALALSELVDNELSLCACQS
jgi:hypothetical protein